MLYFILTLSLGSLILSNLSTSPLAKFFFMAFAVFVIITVGLKYVYNLSVETLKNEQKRQQIAKSNAKYHKNQPKSQQKYKSKVVEDENYKDLVQILKYFMQNKVLSHEQIMDFIEEINERLGEHAKYYKSNSFENNLHEIYSKLKSKQLKSDDYIELTEILKSYNS